MAFYFTDPCGACFQAGPYRLIEEGGVEARHRRYCENHRVLVEGMRSLGFVTLLDDAIQSPIITSFLYPKTGFDFKAFYTALKSKGFVIYPEKFQKRILSVSVISEMYIRRTLPVWWRWLERLSTKFFIH